MIAADVYSASSYVGRGGWTWYTGSSGWMYRAGLEAILGIRRIGKTLQIDLCIPKMWSSYQVTYRVGETVFQISVKNSAGVNRGVKHVELDGIILKNNAIPLVEDGRRHQVNVALG